METLHDLPKQTWNIKRDSTIYKEYLMAVRVGKENSDIRLANAYGAVIRAVCDLVDGLEMLLAL